MVLRSICRNILPPQSSDWGPLRHRPPVPLLSRHLAYHCPLLRQTLQPILIHQIGVRPDGSPAVGPEYPHGIAAAATLPDNESGRRRHPDAADFEEEVGVRARLFHTFLCTVLLTTCFMHCKNVAVRDAPAPPDRLARAYRKRHGRPLTTYKVLEIAPMRQVLRREGQADATGLRRAVHLCRGHFAHYTHERPLFGKVAGTFWRPMHLRGSPSEGLVLKDYTIRAPPSSLAEAGRVDPA
jgi:hypothetical protein